MMKIPSIFIAKVFSISILVIMGYHQLLWITQTSQSFDTALYFNVGAMAGILASKIKLQGHLRVKEIIILTSVLLIILNIVRLTLNIDNTTLFAYLGLISGIPIYVCTKKAYSGLEKKLRDKKID
ncbi:hypothetical protein HLK66_25030 [Niallia circulans]|uniref:hypothetical protein n=1 Tax=Niallia circulans TaxID=1397 RepID=UPI00149032DF|nr:hypothetical protein [Niallia circulans]QJX64592.1 hypothetical protein HLK66_25030 [Niallia circulans]